MLTNEEHGICILKKVLRSRHPHHPAIEGAVVAWGHDHAFGGSGFAKPQGIKNVNIALPDIRHLRHLSDISPPCPSATCAILSESSLICVMKSAGAKRSRKPTTKSDPRARFAPNHLKREFTAEQPNSKWVSDTKAVETAEG